MLSWLKESLETFLGKTITGLVIVFVLGAIAMKTLPNFLRATLKEDFNRIENKIEISNKWRRLEIYELRLDIYKIFGEDLQQKVETEKTPQLQRKLKEVDDEVESLIDTIQKLRVELQQQ